MTPVCASDDEDENVILSVVNTCTVTAKAEQKARRLIRLLLKKYPRAVTVVTGCYAQVNKPEIESISGRIAVLPGRLKSRLADVPLRLRSILEEHGTYSENSEKLSEAILSYLRNELCAGTVPDASENPFRLAADTFLRHSRSAIKIQDGCNNRCTYCKICIARGKSVSLSVDGVLEQVEKIKRSGQKEIVITTVNAAQYSSEYENRAVDFAGLLEILLQRTQDISFRISSLYPQIVDSRFCGIISDARIRPHFHLSVQSGSDAVLKKMARPYNIQTVIDACGRLKAAKKNPFLACDIIAGFPSESDVDFEKTMELVETCGFAWVHAFPFSPRPGTAAFSMKPRVPESVADARVSRLLDFSFRRKIEYVNSCRGEIRTAVVEKIQNGQRTDFLPGEKRRITAVTDNFLHCSVSVPDGVPVPASSSEVAVRILSPDENQIRRNGEIDAFAELSV